MIDNIYYNLYGNNNYYDSLNTHRLNILKRRASYDNQNHCNANIHTLNNNNCKCSNTSTSDNTQIIDVSNDNVYDIVKNNLSSFRSMKNQPDYYNNIRKYNDIA